MEYKSLYNDFCKYVGINYDDVKEYITDNIIDETDGQHIWFGMVVLPYIINIIKNNDEVRLKKTSEFFEEMAKSNNSEITEVLEFTVLEGLASEYIDEYLAFKKYFMNETVKSCDNIEKYVLVNK